MSGVRAEDGRGADIVISEFTDLLPLVKHFEETDAKSASSVPEKPARRFEGEVLSAVTTRETDGGS